MRAFVLFIFFFSLLTACEPEQPEADVGDFFSAEAISDSVAADERGVNCVGASAHEQGNLNHPELVRGSVFAPPQKKASWSLFNSAYAVPIAGEVPIASVKVTLGTEKSNWRETTTDPLGRFCLRMPYLESFGSGVRLTAYVGDQVLRRSAPIRENAIISAQSEAVFRIAEPHFPVPHAALVNLQTIADTRTDLGGRVTATADLAETIERSKADLERDERIIDWNSRRK